MWLMLFQVLSTNLVDQYAEVLPSEWARLDALEANLLTPKAEFVGLAKAPFPPLPPPSQEQRTSK